MFQLWVGFVHDLGIIAVCAFDVQVNEDLLPIVVTADTAFVGTVLQVGLDVHIP
jgi:hypothetical protein